MTTTTTTTKAKPPNLVQESKSCIPTQIPLTRPCNSSYEKELIVTLVTDELSNETSFTLIKDIIDIPTNGKKTESSIWNSTTQGSYCKAQTKYIYSTCVAPSTKCYNFTIHDTGGDGICCNHGNGTYQLVVGGKQIKSTAASFNNGMFSAGESTIFGLCKFNVKDYGTPAIQSSWTALFHADASGSGGV